MAKAKLTWEYDAAAKAIDVYLNGTYFQQIYNVDSIERDSDVNRVLFLSKDNQPIATLWGAAEEVANAAARRD